MSNTRIYTVTTKGDDSAESAQFVDAANPAQVLRYLAEQNWTVRPATTRELADAMRTGGKVTRVRVVEPELDLSALDRPA